MSMGVYIEGIEMPKEDEEIIIRIDSSGTVMTEYALPISGTKAVPVPPHGRLIDGDVAYEQFLNLMDTQGVINPCQLGTILVDATTIIEAEEET